MNERSFIVKSFDKTGLIPGFLPRAHRVLAGIIPAGSKPRSGLPGEGRSFKSRAVLAPLRRIGDFVPLGRQRRRHPLWLLDKLQDRQDCA